MYMPEYVKYLCRYEIYTYAYIVKFYRLLEILKTRVI